MQPFDVIVVGLGTTGSATAYALARRGRRVLGLDAHRPPHSLGSHHGESRIIRKAYYEHPAYVPLLDRAFRAWETLERESGARLWLRTGALMIGAPTGELVAGVLASAREHHLDHERLSSDALMARFPAFRAPAALEAVWEADGGILFPEVCVETFLAGAAAAGATLAYDEPVHAWDTTASGVVVETARGRYTAGAIVLAAGAGMPRLAAGLTPPLTVERQVVAHFAPRAAHASFDAARFPVFCLEQTDGAFYYGFADLGRGVKAGQHHRGAQVALDTVDRTVAARDLAPIRGFLDRHLPDANGALVSSTVCLYTNTPDFHFLVDRLPGRENVVIASACSGHGFKFAPVTGEIAANLACGEPPGIDTSLLTFAARA